MKSDTQSAEWSGARLVEFKSIGAPDIGYINVAESQKQVPFDIKRVFWTHATPGNVIRGEHAHRDLHQLLVAAHGRITVQTEDRCGKKAEFVLGHPAVGLYVPPLCWHPFRFSKDAVLVCMASEEYRESDYIRDYDQFLSLCKSYRT